MISVRKRTAHHWQRTVQVPDRCQLDLNIAKEATRDFPNVSTMLQTRNTAGAPGAYSLPVAEPYPKLVLVTEPSASTGRYMLMSPTEQQGVLLRRLL
ncbi:MAG: hypothetical protein RMK93_05235 [Bacteroidota bacterium]|nr:hypothetical protein [Bacteroidota bacterium]